jgi:sugar (pentulose or hexulose) kinase
MSTLALGIDIGTSGVRAAVLNLAGDVVGLAANKFASMGGNPASPATWGRATEATLAAAAAQIDLARVGAVAIDGTSGTMVAIDANGEPIGPARMYDEPCKEAAVLDRIAAVAPEGSPALGRTSALARVMLMQERPGVWKVVHQADWIAGRLGGRFDQSDENNALKTGYDPIARRWPDWIQRAGVDPSKLPTVHAPGARIGGIGAVGEKFGLPGAALICAGTTDGCASFLATGACEVGDAVTALGSTLVIKLLSDKPIHSADYGVYSHRLGDRWLVGGASNTGGKVIEALFPEGDLDALTAALRPEAPTWLHYYPLVRAGERFPINDPHLQPRLAPRPAERERFFQAVLEGIGEVEALAYRRLRELGAPSLKSVRSLGGGAANAAWTKIRQGLIGAPFLSALSDEACVGAARLALGALRGG